jgi:hypothetical protein
MKLRVTLAHLMPSLTWAEIPSTIQMHNIYASRRVIFYFIFS